MRTFFIWLFGLLAGAIFGGILGSHLSGDGGVLLGFLGGMLAFACFRLWFAAPANARS